MIIFDTKNLKTETEIAPEKPMIMVVDDEIGNLNVLRHLLEAEYDVKIALNGKEAVEIIEKMEKPEDIQLIISDQRMPELTGVELFEQIQPKIPETIRIILTGYSDIYAIMDAINKANIYKFMTKPFESAELVLTVKRGIEAFAMRKEILDYTHNLEEKVESRTRELAQKNQELHEALEKLELASLTDQLTGANNRHFFYKFIQPEIKQLERKASDVGLAEEDSIGFILVDADHFKHVNDTYGHNAGDLLLKQLTRIMHDICRENDWVVRWGGEEFLIVCRGTPASELKAIAERVRKSIEAFDFDIGEGKTINKTCSIGLCSYPFVQSDIDFLTLDQTLHMADMALYMVKNGGRNAWARLANLIELPDKHHKHVMQEKTEDAIEQGFLAIESSNSKLDK